VTLTGQTPPQSIADRNPEDSYLSRFGTDLLSRVAWTVLDWRRCASAFWYRTDKGALVIVLITAVIVTIFAFVLQAVLARQDDRRNRTRELHAQNLTCLARNVYFEARGEPAAGQYAVAEVTMNRKASGIYPRTVCGVVYEQNWDPIRKRYVGAFSWTEFRELPEPSGEEWQRAWKAAEAVYYGRRPPALQGALYFHATSIEPNWAKDKQPVARIGRHIFYR